MNLISPSLFRQPARSVRPASVSAPHRSRSTGWLLAALLLSTAVARIHAADPYQDLASWKFGKSREPLALIDAEVRKAAPAEYAAIEDKLLPVLQSAATTKDAQRYICRWLALVGSAKSVPALAPLLADTELAHAARMALEPMPNPAAGAALREGLRRLKGNLLAGVIASLGIRRDAQAVADLGVHALNADPLIAETALRALGAIGTPEAASILDRIQPPDALARTLARARITAAGHLAASGHRSAAVAIYRSLVELAQQPQGIRVAAFKGLVGSLPAAEGARLVTDTLPSADPVMREAAVAAFASAADPALKNAVAQQLPALPRAGQITLLGVLADDPNVAARAAVLNTLERRDDVAVRVAALECLVRHGEAEDVPLFVRLAQNPSAPLADAARKTLQRMSRTGVDAMLIRMVESVEASDRAVVLATLAGRRVETALPTLARLTTGSDPALAAEAAKALGVMGRTEQLPALAQVLLNSENPGLRTAAEDAAAAICRRAADKPAAAAALLTAWEQASAARGRVSLLPLLVITGGEPALTAVSKAVQDERADVREAAIRTLVAWPDASATPHLVAVARSAQNPTFAILALRDGCLRLAAMEETPIARRLELYRSVLELARRPDEKKQAVAGLAQVPSLGALELLQSVLQEASLKNDALLAITRLSRSIGTVYHQQTRAALEALKAQTSDPDMLKQIEQAIKAVQNAGQTPDGFIIAWLLAGPYQQDGKDNSALFDMVFPPEQPTARAEWRPLALPAGGRSGLIEFDKTLGGQNRVVYLRTQITAENEQDAQLEMGSDDGIKVWLNGKVVHANNAVRPNTPNQDKAKIKLRPGANTLLVKVTQGGGEWSACCRLRAADGRELTGVTVAPNPD